MLHNKNKQQQQNLLEEKLMAHLNQKKIKINKIKNQQREKASILISSLSKKKKRKKKA